MSWSRVHRYLALVLVVPLIVWSVTGLLFHLKPGWKRAYDILDSERPLEGNAVAPIASITAQFPDGVTHLELFGTAIGPVYRVSTAAGDTLVNAATGVRLSPLSESDARTLASDAISRSRSKDEYGAITHADVHDDIVRFTTARGPIVEVGRTDARISQHGSDTARIDWLYRIHYLQWTGDKTLDRVLAVVGLALIWLVMIPGLVLAWRRWRVST
jgi:uncharacterized iron-regulated membrane protein